MVVPLALESGELCTGQVILQPISLMSDRLLAASSDALRGAVFELLTTLIAPKINKDNVTLLTSELLDKINQIVVPAGHALRKKKENEALRGRCDSFVVETNRPAPVHSASPGHVAKDR